MNCKLNQIKKQKYVYLHEPAMTPRSGQFEAYILMQRTGFAFCFVVSLEIDRNYIWHNFEYVCRHISILVMLLQCLDHNLYLQNKIKLAHI